MYIPVSFWCKAKVKTIGSTEAMMGQVMDEEVDLCRARAKTHFYQSVVIKHQTKKVSKSYHWLQADFTFFFYLLPCLFVFFNI